MPVEKRSEKRIKKNYFLNLKKKFILGEKITFFNLCHPQANHECLQKKSALSVQPFGRPARTFVRMSCFII